MTNDHIVLLHKLSNVAYKLKELSATKKNQVFEMIQHGLIKLDGEFLLLESKGTELLNHVEAEAKNFLNFKHNG